MPNIVDRFLPGRHDTQMLTGRSESGLILPPKPEYRSSHFSFEILSPELVKQRLEALSDLFDSRETATIRLGPATNGLIETPTVGAPGLKKYDTVAWTGGTCITILINLPIGERYQPDFLDSDKSLFSKAGWRTRSMEADLKRYVDKNLDFGTTDWRDNSCDLNANGRKVAHLSGLTPYKSVSYYLQLGIFNANNPITQSVFENGLRDAMTIAFIYCDYLLQYLGIDVPPTKVLIDPDQFNVTQRLGILLHSLTKAEQQEWVNGGSIAAVLGVSSKYDIVRGPDDRVRLNPQQKQSDEIQFLEDGRIVFLPEPGTQPQLRVIK